MKPWNERSGRIWAGSASIVRIGLAKGVFWRADRIGGDAWNQGDAGGPAPMSFRDGPKDQTRNLEIPGSMLRIAPE